jgi:hypothetical protein
MKATLAAFDPRSGEGRLKIEELTGERGRFYVTVTYGEAGQTRIDYKTYDLKKASEYPFRTNRNDAIKEITTPSVAAGSDAWAPDPFSFQKTSHSSLLTRKRLSFTCKPFWCNGPSRAGKRRGLKPEML